MKAGFYPKLAVESMRKNRRIYLPYVLTCVGMIAMLYILLALVDSPLVARISGGQQLRWIMQLGSWVLSLFALIFLFYTNSFLMRRRNREFGLYNILGMGKQNIARLLLWETLLLAACSLLAGLTLGILFSKMAELGLVNIMKEEVEYSFSLSGQALLRTAGVFAAIFFLLFFRSLLSVHASNPTQLFQSENHGEKPPKANWLLALLGLALLLAAYYLAVSIEDPIMAMMTFFAAVLMVIVATYLLFIAGSVWLCRRLQKNKNYYYKPNHFVSVSSMTYRMKRNGAGLASICILATMVLVMISSTTCLYSGAEDAVRTRYPRNILTRTSFLHLDAMESAVSGWGKRIMQDWEVQAENEIDYCLALTTGSLEGGVLQTGPAETDEQPVLVYLLPLEDYNRINGVNYGLTPEEALVIPCHSRETPEQLQLPDGKTYRTEKVPAGLFGDFQKMSLYPEFYMVVPDFAEAVRTLEAVDSLSDLSWHYGFDMEADNETQIAATASLHETMSEECGRHSDEIDSFSCESAAGNRADFFSTYGGLFFLGIMLSLVFIFAAVLILYYKQISEGYEDQRRFAIMQNVGMTREDIRRSINSQLLTVFFAPLLLAGTHLAFAFPFIRKMLLLFNLNNTGLLVGTTAVSFLLFAALYILVYRVTSNTYYSLVSSGEKQ